MLAVVAAGCGSDGATGATGATGSAAPASSTAGLATGAPGTLPPIVLPSATPASTPAALIEIDPGLLAVLPAMIDGQSLDESPEVEQADIEDPTLTGVARLAAAFVHDGDAQNWAVVTIAAMRPGVLSDAYFRSWRETFDAGACEPAGGTTGSAVAPMGGREVNVGRCAGGVNTYHVRLPGDRIVSVTSFGDKRYGELVMSGLAP